MRERNPLVERLGRAHVDGRAGPNALSGELRQDACALKRDGFAKRKYRTRSVGQRDPSAVWAPLVIKDNSPV
jgi:hypothetical protein